MKILLCTTPLDLGIPRDRGELPMYPKIAIVSIIKWLEKHGYDRKDLDFYDLDMLEPKDEEMRAYFGKTKPDVIGLSAVVSTAYSQVKHIAQIIRDVSPNTWIVLGGSLSVAANVVLHKTEVDICVQSDGENPFLEFCNYAKTHRTHKDWDYEKLAQIKGLSYLDLSGLLQFTGYPQKIPSSENPYPDYDILALGLKNRQEMFKNYFRIGKKSSWFHPDPRSHEPHRAKHVAALWTTKGCVARCTFCQRSTKGYQTNDTDTLDGHLAFLKKKYEVGFIFIMDENFGSDKKHAREVAKLMKKHDLLWICGGVRCTSVDYEDAKFYQEHNCSALKFGVESGSQKILDIMEKRFTVDQVYAALRHCYELGLFSPLAVMTGMPGETNETAMETGQYLGKVARMIGSPPKELGISIFYALPMPGTPLYQYGQQMGLIGKTVDSEEHYLKAVSDRNSDRENYINLNGHSLRHIIFWEFLMRYEATRTYYEKPLGDDCVVHNLNVNVDHVPGDIHGVEHNDEKREMNKLFSSMGSVTHRSEQASMQQKIRWKLNFLEMKKFLIPQYTVWWLYHHSARLVTRLNYKLVYNRYLAKLPRPLVYVPMKNLLYMEYLYVKTVRKILRKLGFNIMYRNLYNDFNFPKPISQKEYEGFDMRIEKSLRHKVKLYREKHFNPLDLTEKNQEVLHMGR